MSDGLIIGNLENLKRLSCALCKTRIHNSQLCVLLIVALSPGTTMRRIVVETHLSEQAVCNLLRRLADMGDITHLKNTSKNKANANQEKQKRQA